jgi:hypothetical protein
MPTFQSLAAFLAAVLLTVAAPAQTVTINNTQPRLDEQGRIVDAHDGNLMVFNNRFYWYGTAYGSTDGFTKANFFQVYSSADLKRWKREGPLLTDAPAGTYYRPKVVFNPRTRQYVLWYNWYPVLWEGQFGVATSDSPTGPFRIVTTDAKLTRSKVGDFNLMVDDDGQAYIVYNTIEGHRIFVERLNADFTGSSGQSSDEIVGGSEGSSLFKRQGRYYLLTDQTCCFCGEGSGARVYVSDQPLSGYAYRGNINRYAGPLVASAHDGHAGTRGGVNVSTTQYAEVILARPERIDRLQVTVPGSRFFSHCIFEAQGRVVAQQQLPPLAVQYEAEPGQWKPLLLPRADTVRQPMAVQTLRYQLTPVRTSRLRIQLAAHPTNTTLPMSEIAVFAGNQNRAAASAGAVVVAVSEAKVPVNSRNEPIIPAQQTYVAQLPGADGPVYVWMGDLWGSRPDGVKGHDFQYWSEPLRFDESGMILPLRWTDEWTLSLKP